MSILITRPNPYGQQLVNQLNAIGKTAWHLPLMTFSPGNDLPLLEKYLKTLSEKDLLFIMSQTAVKYAHTWLSKSHFTWPKKIYYYAIGHSTALQAYKYIKMKSIIYPKMKESSEELLRLLKINNPLLQGRQALIICSNGGRDVLKKTLIKQGMHVITCASYTRIPISYNGVKETEHMIKIGINTIVITSKEILQCLYDLIPNNYKKNWLTKCKLIVISNRIAIYAKTLGWDDIIILKTTNNDYLINILLKIQ